LLLGTILASAHSFSGGRARDMLPAVFTSGIIGTAYLAVFVLDMFAVTWGGMWFGLSSKKESQAATKTILIVLLAPLLASMFSCLGLPVIIGWPIFWIAWARSELRAKFRELAAQRYFGKAAGSGWLPAGMTAAGAPGPPQLSR
jgi:fructose-specific phosphotransferase system IIC component